MGSLGLLGRICDRSLVMHEGEVAGGKRRGELSKERVMALVTGAKEAHATSVRRKGGTNA